MKPFRDPQAAKALDKLRAELRKHQWADTAVAHLDMLVERLGYIEQIGAQWDATHAQQAETYLRLGHLDQASSAAMNVFDADVKKDLLKRIHAAAAPAAAPAPAAADEDWLFGEMIDREVLA